MSSRSRPTSRVAAGVAVSGSLLLLLGMVGSSTTVTEAGWSSAQHGEGYLYYPEQESDDQSYVPGIPDGEDPAEYVDEDEVERINDMPGLDPVEIPDGFEYVSGGPEIHWRSMDFCHSFSLENTSDEPRDWELSFDVSQPPMWGWVPFDQPVTEPGQVAHSDGHYVIERGEWNWGSWETTRWDPESGLWAIRGNGWGHSENRSPIGPGSTAQFQFCPRDVPEPEPQPALYTWSISYREGTPRSWGVVLGTRVETEVRSSIPWEIYIDLEDYVCGYYLDESALVEWGGYVVRPVDGQDHVYAVSLPEDNQDRRIRSDVSTPQWGDSSELVSISAAPGDNILEHTPPGC